MYNAPDPEIVWIPCARPSKIAGESDPSKNSTQAFVKRGSPNDGTYSWLACGLAINLASVFFTTGKTYGWLSSVQ